VDDEPKKRTTSFAKEVEGLFHPPSPLDKPHADVFEAFTRAADKFLHPPTHPTETRDEKEKAGATDSIQRAPAPRPALDLKPSGPIRRAMDKSIDYEKLRAINAAAKRRAAAAERSRSLSRDFDRER